MTQPRTDPWDDDRLEAAFAARDQARPRSASIVEPTLAAVAAVRRPTAVRWMPRLHPALGLLAVMAVIAVVGRISYVSQRPTTGRPTLTDSPASMPTVPSTSKPTPGVETALGLPMCLLYESCIWIAWFMQRRMKRA